MDICIKDKDMLKTVAMYLHTVKPLVETKTQQGKAVKLLIAVDNGLDYIRKDLETLDGIVSKMTTTLAKLKIEHTNTETKVSTSLVINMKNGKPSARMTLEELQRRYEKFNNILTYYCHMYTSLINQIEGQKLLNQMKRDGYGGFGEDNELQRKSAMTGPHVRAMLEEFVNKKG
jgi:hypothetical protein